MRGKVIQSQSNRLLHNKLPVCYPFVKWAGGKTQLLAKLYSFIPSGFSRYFEPFLGGGALFFYLISNKSRPLTTYLSDINSELINSYLVVKDNVDKLIDLLNQHEIKYKKDPSRYYYELRTQDLKKTNRTARAARFIALNRTCYNGLYRVNRQGLFNVPWGKYKDPLICNSSNLRNVSLALQHSRTTIQVGDYKEILLEKVREGDFVYLDPPYNPSSSTSYFTRYTRSGFDDGDQQELAATFRKLDGKGCKILLSNSNTQLIKELYCDFAKYVVEVDTTRSINCKGSKRAGHKELIIRNYFN
jgi:DNA adenine methylase